MKFVNYIEKVSGVDVYGLTSLGIFVTLFIIITISVIKADKKTIKEISEIPLDK